MSGVSKIVSQREEDNSTIKNFLWQAYTLLFRDAFTSFPQTMMGLFNGKLTKSFDTNDFLTS